MRTERDGPVLVVIMDRPERRNAIDRAHAQALGDAFREFEADRALSVAILWGAGGTFCAGADLKAIAAGEPNRLSPSGDAPLGPSRLELTKPVIAAIEGHAVAGGLELACWCDLRVAAADAVLGVFCRGKGVPLIDGGTARLPRIVGLGRALDLVLTGRAVAAEEALQIGLVNRVVPSGMARGAAESLARELAAFPQDVMRADRAGVLFDPAFSAAISQEFERGVAALASGGLAEVERFARGRS